MSLGVSGEEDSQTILKYLRHVAVYRALRASKNNELDPIDVHEPWPADVFPIIKETTLRKQRDFEMLLKQRAG